MPKKTDVLHQRIEHADDKLREHEQRIEALEHALYENTALHRFINQAASEEGVDQMSDDEREVFTTCARYIKFGSEDCPFYGHTCQDSFICFDYEE